MVLAVADDAVLTITDDGVGMPAEVVESGLANMRQRARRHGGEFHVRSGSGEGTAVEWRVPLQA